VEEKKEKKRGARDPKGNPPGFDSESAPIKKQGKNKKSKPRKGERKDPAQVGKWPPPKQNRNATTTKTRRRKEVVGKTCKLGQK